MKSSATYKLDMLDSANEW